MSLLLTNAHRRQHGEEHPNGEINILEYLEEIQDGEALGLDFIGVSIIGQAPQL
jgi:hypothetical protein